MRRDLRLAARGLWRAKSFSAAAILTMGIGIAGAVVMFTIVRGVLLRPLPVRDQARLIVAWKEMRTSGLSHHPFGDREIDQVRDASLLLEAVAGVDANGVGQTPIAEGGEPDYIGTALVTGRFFEVLGTGAILGRGIGPADDVDGAENVLVISHGLWQRRYGADRDVIGRRVTLGEQRFTIVGVMPPGLDYPSGVEAWRTTRSVPTSGPFGDAARREVDLIARLRPSVTIAQAAGELTALGARLPQVPAADAPKDLVPIVRSFEDAIVGHVRRPLFALTAAVGLVLLIAGANVANLLLIRGESRRAELAVRGALGAGRARIIRELLAESALLTLGAAAVGLAAAWWSLPALLALLPDGLPRVDSVRVDAGVLAFTAAMALVSAAGAGIAPALVFGRADLAQELRRGAAGRIGHAARLGRRGLVVAQVAFAVTVVAAAALLARTITRLHAIDIGLAADRLVLVELAIPEAKYVNRDRHAEFLDRAVSALQAVPAIAAATPINLRPFAGEGGWDVPRFTAEGQSADRADANPWLNLESIHPNYFTTFGVPLLRGRAFNEADREGATEVAIVSDDVAAAAWPGQDPIGKRLKFGGPQSSDSWRTVVGVAASTRYRELARPRPTLYLPAAQFLVTAQMLALRTTAALDLVAPVTRDRIRSVDPEVQVMRVAPFARMLDGPLARPRFNAWVSAIFGATALLLAAIGVYAVMTEHVRGRSREIAVRIALGATPRRVRWLVLGEAAWLGGLGTAMGLAGAALAARLLSGMLFGIAPLDPPALAAAALLPMAGSALACYWPVRRATRVDPIAVLRME